MTHRFNCSTSTKRVSPSIQASLFAHSDDSFLPDNLPNSITQLTLARENAISFLYPIVSHLSNESTRWTTWILSSPEERVALQKRHFDCRAIRLIYTRDTSEVLPLFNSALCAGTSDTVIASPENNISAAQMKRLHRTAAANNAQGLLVNYY